MGLFSNKKGTEGQYNRSEYMNWNPEQTALSKDLVNKLQQGNRLYTGDFAAPMSPEEAANVSRASRIGALAEQGLSPLVTDEGVFPEDYFQTAIEKPALRLWQEETKPLLEEQYAGPGGYWSSARAGAVGKSSRDLTNELLANRANIAYQTRENALNRRLTAANTLAGIPGQLSETLQIPRIVTQYGLDKKYEDWVRAEEGNSAYIDKALEFLKLKSVNYEYVPGRAAKPSMFSQIAKPVGTGIGFLVGGPAGAGIGSTIGDIAGKASSGDWSNIDAGGGLGTIFPDWQGLLNVYNPSAKSAPKTYTT